MCVGVKSANVSDGERGGCSALLTFASCSYDCLRGVSCRIGRGSSLGYGFLAFGWRDRDDGCNRRLIRWDKCIMVTSA